MKEDKKLRQRKISLRSKAKKTERKIRPEHEQLVKDIRKGQSMQMLCYLYKMKPYRIRWIASKAGLRVYDPYRPGENFFLRGGCQYVLSSVWLETNWSGAY